ncbi:MAG: hypothetical protein C0418_03935 [Coriobacteriaceae bacterium]|nr:hypothetical protein [Coriobacteriaceae bacterium]
MEPPRVTFPHMGDYWIGFKALAEELDCEVVVPPKMTARTLEIGTRHSPEFVCVPFKYNLGNFIEAIEMGANTIVQAVGGCRFGYYGEVQAAILNDLGYDVRFVRFDAGRSVLGVIRDFRDKMCPQLSLRRVKDAFVLARRKGAAIDAVQDFLRKNLGFQVGDGDMENIEVRFLSRLEAAATLRDIDALRDETLAEMNAVPLVRPDHQLRVGVVGEIYLLMEPFSNCDVERQLSLRGVEVHRHLTMTAMIQHSIEGYRHVDDLIARSGGWVRHHIGAHGTESVSMTHEFMEDGFDGVVHLKPFGCMPEVNAMAIMQKMSRERTFPILFLSYDSQTAEAGVRTRIEAFCDMLEMRKGGVVRV